MANRVITPTVQLGLGGSFYALVLAETHYKFWDMVPINNGLSIRQRMSTGTPPTGWSSGDTLTLMSDASPVALPTTYAASALPEGGVAVSLDGASQYLSSVYDETAAPGTTQALSLEVVLLIHAVPSAATEPAVMGGSTEFAVTMRDDGRVYGYYNGSAVVDLPVTLNETSHIVLTRTGASPDVITLWVNGVSDTASVAQGGINRGHVHLGRHWTDAEYLEATYSFAAFYPRALSALDVAARFAAASWTDVSDDVMVDPSLVIERGIRDDTPSSRVASTGLCTFALDNSERNSTATLGYYSPGHASVRPGFARGIPVRVLVDDQVAEYEIFRGRVQTIAPVPGVDGIRNTLIVATDLLDDIARFRLNQVAIQEDVRGDEVFSALLNTLPTQPNGITIAQGSEVYDLALDNTQDESVTMLQEFQRLGMSEFGRIYVNRSGGIVYENRQTRAGQSLALSLDDTQLAGMDVAERTRDAINRVEVTVHPRVVDDDPTTVLFALQSPLEIPAGETRVILGPYRIESAPDTVVRVGGLNLEPPVPVTDYLMNTAADGSGTDVTTSLSVVANYGANGVQYRLTNTSGGTAFVTRLQARGRGVYDFRTVVVVAEDEAAISAHGVNAISLDLPYQEDAGVAKTIADGVLAAYGPLTTRARQVQLYANDEDLAGILALDVSRRVSVTETLSNVSGEAFINGTRFEFQAGTLGVVTWWLAPPEESF